MHNLPLQKKKLIFQYASGKSMEKIALGLDCSVHKVVYWMNKYGLKRRTHSQASYLQFNPNGDPFKIKEKLGADEKFLLGLGLGIYWGEGEKVSRQHVRVANTDPAVLKIFVKFLLKICQLKKSKLSYSIVCFNDSNPNEVKSFWSKQLKISPEKFGKIVQIPPQGKGKYKRKSVFGVCTVYAGNVKLKAWIMQQIDNIAKSAV
ncbi:MAG: hypothetical protein M1120_03105 [Patescibacteria group bacterium]|nr:hypothetical protein [Patescibacteria group bacterium]